MPLLLLLFSHSVMFDPLWPHGLQHTRLPCPLLYPWVYWNSCSLSQWCHQTISSSLAPFSSCSHSFPGSWSFPMNWVCLSSGQSIGASPSASILPMNIQDWFPLELADLISLLSRWLSRVLSTPQFISISSLLLRLLYGTTLTSIHDYWKTITLTVRIFALCTPSCVIIKNYKLPIISVPCIALQQPYF